jgi:CheY-like chemotaxis protein
MESQRILVVDSDPLVCINYRLVLRGAEFIVFTAQCGDEAIERIANEKFDVVIADIRLPNVNCGLTVIQETKMLQPKAQIVVTADRTSIWDAKEAIRLGAFGYVEKSSTPEFMKHIVKKIFDKKGWIVKKADIDQFRDYIVPSAEKDNPALYYNNGSWARHLQKDIWEIGCDVKHWFPSTGHFLFKLPKGVHTLTAGAPFARILSCTDKTNELIAPMTGTIKEINEEANKTVADLVPEQLGEDWMLWLARIQTPVPEEFPAVDLIGEMPLSMAMTE